MLLTVWIATSSNYNLVSQSKLLIKLDEQILVKMIRVDQIKLSINPCSSEVEEQWEMQD